MMKRKCGCPWEIFLRRTFWLQNLGRGAWSPLLPEGETIEKDDRRLGEVVERVLGESGAGPMAAREIVEGFKTPPNEGTPSLFHARIEVHPRTPGKAVQIEVHPPPF